MKKTLFRKESDRRGLKIPALSALLVLCLMCAQSPAEAAGLTDAPGLPVQALSTGGGRVSAGGSAQSAPQAGTAGQADQAGQTNLAGQGSIEAKVSAAELYEELKAGRQRFLETRLEVIKKANDAKLRLEELVRNDKPGATQSGDALKKDLDKIKEAQRVLATILSDIVHAAGSEASVIGGAVGQSGAAGAGGQSASGASAGQNASAGQGEADASGAGQVAGNTAPAQGGGAGVTGAGAGGQGPAADTAKTGTSAGEGMPSREHMENLIRLYEEKNRQLAGIAEALDGIVPLQ